MKSVNERYSRQILFWPNKDSDQSKLSQKTVTLIGVGALGTVIANQLVRAGIGTLRIIDRDFVDQSNLQRQMLFNEEDVESTIPKAVAAANKLLKTNSEVNIEPYIQDINSNTIESFINNCDLIMDATDNMVTRFLINDVSVKYQIPWIYGGAIHSRGMFFPIIPGETPCLQCLFPITSTQNGETCDTVGVLGPLVHIVASYQVAEAFKVLLGYDTKRNNQLTQIDTWFNDYDELPISDAKNPDCHCCSKKVFAFLEGNTGKIQLSQLCGRDSIQIIPPVQTKLDLAQWEKKWAVIGEVKRTPFLLRLHIAPFQLTLFQDGRLLIKGTQDEIEAKKIYTKYVGN